MRSRTEKKVLTTPGKRVRLVIRGSTRTEEDIDMPLVSEVYPAKYLKASILNGRTVKVEIETVTTEVMAGAGDRKLVVYFSGRGQGLVLNKTNANELALCFGDDYDGWRGKTIELYPQQVSYQGRDVDAIRVRPIVADPATGSVDDDIPF